MNEVTCPYCNGEGEFFGTHRFDCMVCWGSGKITSQKNDEIKNQEQRSKYKRSLIDQIESKLWGLPVEKLKIVLDGL